MLENTSEEFHQEVCKNVNTSLHQVKKDVEVLKDWIRQQPHLPQTSSDELLTCFLIASKNRMERAKERIDNYYTARLDLPYLFENRDPEDERMRLMAEEIGVVHLPKVTPDGCRVIMNYIISGDASKYDLPMYCKRMLALQDIAHNSQPFTMGEYIVFDAKLFTASHLRWFTPTLCRDYAYCIQNTMPVIIKGIIIMNSPTYVQIAVNVIRPFMKKKLFDRIHIHTEGPEILEKYFPRKMLPRDYGGEEDTRNNLKDAWTKLLMENRDWLMTEGVVTTDESKRIGGSTNRRRLGFQEMQGSFKTLCVD